MSNIDDIFKKGLDGKGMEYSDASWAGMEQMLNTKKVGFFARYKLLLGVGSVLLVSSIALIYLNSLESDTKANTPAIVADSADPNVHTGEVEISLYDNPTKVTDYKTSKDPTYQKSWTPSDQQEELAGSAKNEGSPSSSGKSSLVKTTPIKDSSAVNSSFLDPTDNGFRYSEPLTATMTSDGETGLSSAPSVSDATDELLSTLAPSDGFELLVKPKFQEVISARPTELLNIPYEFTPAGAQKLDFLHSPKKRKFAVFLSPYAGYVNYRKNEALPKLASDFESNLGKSVMQTSFNYGLNVGVKRGNWMLTSGLGIVSLQEKTYYTESEEEYSYIQSPKISDINYTTTPRGTRVALVTQQTIDSTLSVTTRQVCEGCEVSFDYVSVPLNLQYNLGKRRLRYFAEVGVSASFLTSARGTYATLKNANGHLTVLPSVQLVDLSTSDDIAKMLLYGNAAVGAKFWLTSKWCLWTSYGYGRGLNSMLGSYEQKPTIQNVRVGMEFKLR